MTNPSNSAVQNLLPVQAYFNLDGSFNTFIGQGVPFYATANPIQSGLTITSSTINSSPIGGTSPSTGVFTNIATTTGTISTQPSGATDIVNLLALQSYITGISWKQPCAVATLTNITLSGLQTIDTYTTLAGDRVLVKNQGTAANNGIYIAASGAWTRATDADTWNELICAISFIEYGTQSGGAWFCTAQPGGTIGVTAVNWSQFTTSATYTAGTGLTLTGTQFSITPVGTASTYGSATQTPVFTTNASGQVIAVTNTTITPAVGSITGFGTGVATALGVNVGTAGAFVINGGALGTPSSGTVTNLTGTASININGTVGATTASSGAFTVLSTSSTTSTTPTLGFNASNASIAMGATIAGSYLQTMLQNKSGTAGASANYVLSNDLGTDSTYYGEFGMNSSVFSASTPSDFFSINNGIYFSGHDGDVSVGSGNGYKHYFVWGSTGQSAHVINATGALGFSTNLGTTPALSGTTGYGTAGQVLSSNGSASAPTWVNPSSLATAAGGSNTQVQYNSGGSLAGSANMTFSGTGLTLANDASISGLTVGKGGGAVSTNTAVGASALSGNTTGTRNTALGNNTLDAINTGSSNVAIGSYSMHNNTSGAEQVAIGDAALGNSTTGTQNTVVGRYSMANNSTGSSNVAMGYQSLQANTTASNNTAVGYQAGYANVTGTGVAYFGYLAGQYQTGNLNTGFGYGVLVGVNGSSTGTYNAAFGNQALNSLTTGSYNVALGSAALLSNTTASNNTAVGYQAGYTNTTGSGIVAVGYQALKANTASNNTAVGNGALALNTSGTFNTAIGGIEANGYPPLYTNTTGNYHVAIGNGALSRTDGAQYNVAVGYQSLYLNTTASYSTALGYKAGYVNTAGGNTFLGANAGIANTTGSGITAIGYGALANNTTGTSNIAIGGYDTTTGVPQALATNTTGSYNIAMGVGALQASSTGSYNTALGYATLYSNSTASNNTAVGYQAGYSTTVGQFNCFLGKGAGYTNSTGIANVFIGYQAGYTSNAAASSGANVAIGYQAGYSMTTGEQNTFVGAADKNTGLGAGSSMTTGSKNSIFGAYNGNQGGLDIRTASNYIVLSDGDGNPRGVFDASGNFFVGYTAASVYGATSGVAMSGTSTGVIVIGHATGVTSGNGYANFNYNGTAIGSITQNGTTGVLYNLTSDYRLKDNPQPLTGASEFIMSLQPKTWDWWDGSGKGVGFIAHEFMEVAKYSGNGEKDAVDEDGKPVYQSIQPSSSEVMANLVAMVQELNAKVTALEAKLGK